MSLCRIASAQLGGQSLRICCSCLLPAHRFPCCAFEFDAFHAESAAAEQRAPVLGHRKLRPVPSCGVGDKVYYTHSCLPWWLCSPSRGYWSMRSSARPSPCTVSGAGHGCSGYEAVTAVSSSQRARCACRWIPSSARVVALGSYARGTGCLQVQLAVCWVAWSGAAAVHELSSAHGAGV